MASSLPPNVHISTHPCARAKLSLLRSHTTNARETKSLIHEIALIVGCEALAHGLRTVSNGQDHSPLAYAYTTETISPARICLVPILRSGLSMLDALQSLLPHPVPVHHLGMYREKATLQPVEYYNNLPYHSRTSSSSSPALPPSHLPRTPTPTNGNETGPADLVILLDPVVATGATACAAIDTLRDWGVRRIVVVSVLGSEAGLRRAAGEWGEGGAVEMWVAGVDGEVDGWGMIKPGLGDVGDRLFLTVGK